MSSRKLVYPYTFCAKLALFPFKYYYDNVPFFKYYMWAILLASPIMYKIQTLVCTESNYLKQEEFRRKEIEEYRHHAEHLD